MHIQHTEQTHIKQPQTDIKWQKADKKLREWKRNGEQERDRLDERESKRGRE